MIGKGSENDICNCNPEEADTRIMDHLFHCLKHGARNIQIRTVDTDVVVLLLGSFCDIIPLYPNSSI